MILGLWFTLVGCGPTCQSTCNQIWRVCGVPDPAGRDVQELARACERECEAALRVSGEIGDYEPEERRTVAEAITLDNDTQAAAWMDCVWNHAPDGTPEQCEDLDPRSGYCAPI